ncbi:HlyC/CorC family transporter [Blautia liquoris]|uniref:HlyC/CorC family transporter n=1 Tax=Blautia liquoris TaxID=2779518 RepID=A0A7M2RDV7_9FIRM|nr:hemolysin family protein [Blautia liquoris]QOV18171.1 HlyC/CorC family transporter [Blautia liquoris]
MDSDPLLWPIILQVILIALNAIFACAEIAVVSMNETKLAKMASDGDKRAISLEKLTSSPSRFLATIQVAITLSGFMGSAYAADNFSGHLVKLFVRLGVSIPTQTLNSISVFLITLILSYFTLIFGELVPKRIAMKNTEKVALGMARVLNVIANFFSPIVGLLTVSTNGVLRLIGIDPNQEDDGVSEEEIRMMIDAGSKKGTIDLDENEMIQNVFEFDDITLGEICTHRTDVVVLWADDKKDIWENTIHASRHSIFPVCGEGVDDILGVMDAKDFFRLHDLTREEIMAKAVKPAYFVPENIKADILFSNMKKSGNYFAVVLDEYGGMEGIITLRDLIEQLVGDLVEEDDEKRPEEIEQIGENIWKIQGYATLDDVQELLNVRLPVEEYDTFGGYIFGNLGSIPDDGSQFELETDELQIKVVEVKEHRVESTIVQKIEKEEMEQVEESKGR